MKNQTLSNRRFVVLGPILVVGLCVALLTPWSFASTVEVSATTSVAEATDDKKEKKRKRQRGKNVRAVTVSATPAAKEPAKEEATPAPAAPTEPTAPAREVEPKAAEPKEATPEPTPAPATSPAPAEPKAAEAAVEPTPTPRDRAPAARQPEPTAAPLTPPEPEPVAAAPAPAPATIDRDIAPDADPTFSERIRVTEVLMDVLVTNRKGETIQGLDASDFVITEDGEEREVTSVTFYGDTAELSGSGQAGSTRTDRYFILFFHDQAQTEPGLMAPQLQAGKLSQRWVAEDLLPNDQVAVMGYDVRLKIYQDFTRDKGLLREAIEAAARGTKEPDRWSSRSAPELDPNSPSLLVNLPTGKALARSTRKIQQALELVGRASEGIVGRKNLLLYSVGFGEILQLGNYSPDPRYFPPMKEALNTGNVAVYSIDMLGARRGSPAFQSINDSLSAISSVTGGHYYSTFANVLAPIRSVARENTGYYLVSFRSEYENGTNGYREVKVKTRDKKHKVRTREGYRYGGGGDGS